MNSTRRSGPRHGGGISVNGADPDRSGREPGTRSPSAVACRCTAPGCRRCRLSGAVARAGGVDLIEPQLAILVRSLEGTCTRASSATACQDTSGRGVIAGAGAATVRSAALCTRSRVPCAWASSGPAPTDRWWRPHRAVHPAWRRSRSRPGPAASPSRRSAHAAARLPEAAGHWAASTRRPACSFPPRRGA